ncbi:MAG: LysM peptidoglycan-binding domain-containing protein [Flavobacteriales bacterium]|nr:LysM peptidoglycan-binding domain-containing protein [Flavobacteriales bacterium]
MTHKVKQGETLAMLSSKYNITTDTIKWANDITDENSLQPNSELTILPINGILYVAKENEDIAALAQKYQSNASLIESFNGLEGKAPEVGTKLIIPDGIKPAPQPAGYSNIATTNIFGSTPAMGSSARALVVMATVMARSVHMVRGAVDQSLATGAML